MNFFEIVYFGINENLFLGIFHGILFSFPFSIPFLICLRYFVLTGLRSGLSSFFGTMSGQLLFFAFLCSGARPLIQFWYSVEPILAFFGIILTFQIATNFYEQKKFFTENILDDQRSVLIASSPQIGLRPSALSVDTTNRGLFSGTPDLSSVISETTTLKSVTRQISAVLYSMNERGKILIKNIVSNDESGFAVPKSINLIKIFFFQFFLIFFNPLFPALSTRIILSQDILFHFSYIYCLGFITGGLLCITSFIISFQICGAVINEVIKMSIQFFRRIEESRSLSANSDFNTDPTASPLPRGFTAILQSRSEKFLSYGQFIDKFPELINSFFVFSIIGFLLYGTLQYTWRFLTQYPLEFLPEIASGEADMRRSTNLITFTRDFPTQDSNIRHREKTLPVERHIPIERINARRTLSGRPPLNEEQKSDAYIKYNSFFLNKIEHIFENVKIKFRDTKADEVKQYASDSFGSATAQYMKMHDNNLRNNTKGKPKFSYIRDLFILPQKVNVRNSVENESELGSKYGSGYGRPSVHAAATTSSLPILSSRNSGEAMGQRPNISLNPYIHDDLSLYYGFFKQITTPATAAKP
jgi:hypothetical protein